MKEEENWKKRKRGTARALSIYEMFFCPWEERSLIFTEVHFFGELGTSGNKRSGGFFFYSFSEFLKKEDSGGSNLRWGDLRLGALAH